MKKGLIICFALVCVQTINAQNTNPWPAIGNVGIGTTTPGVYALSIEKSNTDGGDTDAPVVSIKNTSTFLPAGSGLNAAWTNLWAGNGAILGQVAANYGVSGAGPFSAGSGVYLTTRTNHPIIFATGATSTEKMRITSTGSVGIGNANPAHLLDIARNANDATPLLNIRNSNAGASAQTSINLFNNAGFTFGTHGAMLSFTSSTTTNPNTVQLWNFMNGSIRFGTNNAEVMRIAPNGNVGIGAISPGAKLDVQGNRIRVGSDFSGNPGTRANNTLKVAELTLPHYVNAEEDLIMVRGITNGSTSTVSIGGGTTLFNSATEISFWTGATNATTTGVQRMKIDADGNVAIGTINLPASDAKLAVKGIIYSQKVRVTQAGWADYVFDSGYPLRPLCEVEQYIQQHHHLPEVPSAADVQKNGLDLGDNQATLLKKIEELTLYVIEQNKRIEQLTEQNKRIEQLENALEAIKNKASSR